MKFKEADLERAFESLGGDPSADAARVLAEIPDPPPPHQPVWPLIIGAALAGAVLTALLMWIMLPGEEPPVLPPPVDEELRDPEDEGSLEKLLPRPRTGDPSELMLAQADLDATVGNVMLASDGEPGEPEPRRLYSGSRLAYGQTYQTSADSFAAISLDKKVQLRIGPGTTLVLMDENSLNLLQGMLWVQNQPENSPVYVFTNEGDIGAEPGSVITLNADEERLQLATFVGNASFDTLAGEKLRLSELQLCESTGGLVEDPRQAEQPWYYYRWQLPLLTRTDREEEVVGMLSALAMDLEDPDPEKQELASEEFRRLGGLSARALALALEGMVDSGDTRRRVVFLFCDVADLESQGRLLDLLRSQDGEERARAAVTLVRVTGEAMDQNWDERFWREAPHSDRESALINYRRKLPR
ncbi:MAG: FecR family protein [Planctomycetota bacterium]|jgi:hypothetical protein